MCFHTHQLLFIFLISLVAHWQSALVLLVLDLLPDVSSSEMGSTSTRVRIELPNARHKSLEERKSSS